ncbi:MAG: hypothetical protein EA424_22655, partial [Planctomycetaceae bacterium]
VNGDGVVSPADVLSIINRLNSPPASDHGSSVFDVTGGGGAAQGVGEGEAPLTASTGGVWWTSDRPEDQQAATKNIPVARALLPVMSLQTGSHIDPPDNEALADRVPAQADQDFVRRARDGYFRDLATHPRLQQVNPEDDLVGPRQAAAVVDDERFDLFELYGSSGATSHSAAFL